MTYRRVATRDDVWAGERLSVRAAGRRVLLVCLRADGTFRAYEDRCAHLGAPLGQGRFEADRLICAAHGWTYDASSGQCSNPCELSLRAFPVRLDGEDLLVDLPEPDAMPAARAEGPAR